MASEKVYVCGRCSDYGAPNLEDLVTHMSNCGVPDIRKKGSPWQDSENLTLATQGIQDEAKLSSSPYEDEDNDITFDESENSQTAIEYVDISVEKDSPPQKKRFLDGTPTSSQSEYQSHFAGRISPSPFLWGKKTGMMLLNLIKSHKEDMESPYIRKKTVWQKIAMEMKEKYGYCVTASQCENKFKNMSNRYRRARDHNNIDPDCKLKQTCFLYDELDEYFRSDASYQPKRDTLFVSRVKQPKISTPSKYIDSDPDFGDTEPMNISGRESINISNREPINISNRESINISNREPINISIREPIKISKGESSNSLKNSAGNETEPVWVKRMMETFERCHRENMKMQREFIDVLKRVLEKK